MSTTDTYFARVQELGLESYVQELDVNGYTVLPPEKVAPADFIQRLTDTVLRVITERTGVEHALDKNGNLGNYGTQAQLGVNQFELWYLLFEDEIFEEWLENETLEALIEHCMRGQGQLSSLMAFVKWKSPEEVGGMTFPLHCDSQSAATAEGRVSVDHELVVNSALLMSDYNAENGSIVMVPGSHRYGRAPVPGEAVDRAVPVEAPAGSLLVWHGTTWHGALSKKTDGLRLCLNAYFCHRSLKTQERYQDAVPEEMLERRSGRFARLMGADDPMGWGAHGPDLTRMKYVYRAPQPASS